MMGGVRVRISPSENLIIWEAPDGTVWAQDIKEFGDQAVMNGVIFVALSALGMTGGKGSVNSSLKNPSGNLQSSVNSARNQIHNSPNITNHANERMQGSRGDGSNVSVDRVVEASFFGTMKKAKPGSSVASRTMKASESASGRSTTVIQDVRTNNVITVIDKGSKK